MKNNDTKVLVIGWDGADWKVASPLMDQGKMPHLQRMVDAGVMGNISTLYPVLSPMLWTSIATGKRAHKHGIHGFVEPDPQSGGVRPITNLGRHCKAVWNILNQQGLRSNVVGWWPSHPAEPIDGVMVSNHFQKSTNPPDKPWPMRHGTVHPASLAQSLAKFRVHPAEIEGSQLLPFVPDAASIDQSNDPRLNGIANILAETAGVQAVATAIMQHEPWDFMAVYFDAIDHFCHGFMKYHPPRESWVDEKDFELYNKVIETAYRFHDIMLGALLELAGADTHVILVSDHGFHPDHLRPRMIGNEPAGPADEHRQFGVFAMRGPGIRSDGLVFGASLLDITPTILTLYGLPVGADMDGRPLLKAFEDEPELRVIDSWEAVAGNDGRHPPGLQVDAIDAHESVQQLVDLGYIDEPDKDSELAATNARRELRYNLARDYFDARMIPEASAELQALWDECPDESRFGVLLFKCWLSVGNTEQAGATLDRLIDAKTAYAKQARAELESLKAERERRQQASGQNAAPGEEQAAHGDSKTDAQKLRRLVRRAQVNPLAFAYFRGCLHHARGEFDKALKCLRSAQGVQVYNQPSLKQKMGECYLGNGDWDRARKCFEQILAIDPISAQAQLGLAQTALGERRPRQAYRAACSAIGLIYHNPRAHYVAARALCELGRINKASGHLETALAQSPAFPDAHRLAAAVAHKRGDADRAERHETLAADGDRRLAELREARVSARQRATSLEVDMDLAPGIGNFGADGNGADPHCAPLIVVSGLPRSGTSMMMQMLAAGGLPTLTDEHRPADESNPRGYFEFAPVKKLGREQAWLRDAGGKAVKVVAQLLARLPPDCDKRVIFMARPLGEVVGSQAKMLARLDRAGAAVPAPRLAATYAREIEALATQLAQRERVAAITVSYVDAVEQPAAVARQVNRFLGGELDEQAMAAVVDATLYRQRSG